MRTLIAFVLVAAGCGASEPTPTTPAAAGTEAPSSASVAIEPPSPDTATGPEGLGLAPDFTLEDLGGNAHHLSAYRGKTVVLEWFNPGCPFVKYAYGQGPLKGMAAREVAKGDLVWLTINSGAPGKQGHGRELNETSAHGFGMEEPLLLDESGSVGKLYGAKSTPHMFVIAPNGHIVYRGALDNAPLGKADGPLINYVEVALAALRAGDPIETAETPSYGCSVKYAD